MARVLVVDDDRDIRNFVLIALVDEGHDVLAHEARRRAAEVRADDVLGKPFDLDRLLDIVARHTAFMGWRKSPS